MVLTEHVVNSSW